jgi:hypothetical protein
MILPGVPAMKAAFHTSPKQISLTFPLLLTLTAIVCLTVMQSLGVNAGLSLATASTLLVFCARPVVPSTWEVLLNAYFLRTTPHHK